MQDAPHRLEFVLVGSKTEAGKDTVFELNFTRR
jgi:hypothetical protein